MAKSTRRIIQKAGNISNAYWRVVSPDTRWVSCFLKSNSSRILNSEFWRLEIERVKGECALFLGPKSKHTQFSIMCKDPSNDKFKVEKEADLQVLFRVLVLFASMFQAYWDAMVAPSINDFCNRIEWLTKSSGLAWVDAQKNIKPVCPIGQSPARPARRRQMKLVSLILIHFPSKLSF